jgi:hypothetical protein
VHPFRHLGAAYSPSRPGTRFTATWTSRIRDSGTPTTRSRSTGRHRRLAPRANGCSPLRKRCRTLLSALQGARIRPSWNNARKRCVPLENHVVGITDQHHRPAPSSTDQRPLPRLQRHPLHAGPALARPCAPVCATRCVQYVLRVRSSEPPCGRLRPSSLQRTVRAICHRAPRSSQPLEAWRWTGAMTSRCTCTMCADSSVLRPRLKRDAFPVLVLFVSPLLSPSLLSPAGCEIETSRRHVRPYPSAAISHLWVPFSAANDCMTLVALFRLRCARDVDQMAPPGHCEDVARVTSDAPAAAGRNGRGSFPATFPLRPPPELGSAAPACPLQPPRRSARARKKNTQCWAAAEASRRYVRPDPV